MPNLVIPGPLAIFDLDRTLHAGSGLGVLAGHAFRSRLIGPERMVRSLLHDLVFRKLGSTDGHISSIAELALDMGSGTSVAELEPVLTEAAQEIASSVRPAMMAVFDLHQDAGHHCVLLSASPQTLVVRIADILGFDAAIGTVIETDDGVLTGKIVPPMCYAEGKLDRLETELGWPRGAPVAASSRASLSVDKQLPASDETNLGSEQRRPVQSAPIDEIASYAYADSVSDLPLLESVEAPFVVTPDRRLRAIAAERGWPVLDV